MNISTRSGSHKYRIISYKDGSKDYNTKVLVWEYADYGVNAGKRRAGRLSHGAEDTVSAPLGTAQALGPNRLPLCHQSCPLGHSSLRHPTLEGMSSPIFPTVKHPYSNLFFLKVLILLSKNNNLKDCSMLRKTIVKLQYITPWGIFTFSQGFLRDTKP